MRETLVDAIVKHCRIGIVVLLLALGGCAQLPQPSVVGEQESVEIPQPPPALSNGSIYQAGRGEVPDGLIKRFPPPADLQPVKQPPAG